MTVPHHHRPSVNPWRETEAHVAAHKLFVQQSASHVCESERNKGGRRSSEVVQRAKGRPGPTRESKHSISV